MVCLPCGRGLRFLVAIFFSLVAVQVREARVVAPRAPWSLRMCVHELMVAEQ